MVHVAKAFAKIQQIQQKHTPKSELNIWHMQQQHVPKILKYGTSSNCTCPKLSFEYDARSKSLSKIQLKLWRMQQQHNPKVWPKVWHMSQIELRLWRMQRQHIWPQVCSEWIGQWAILANGEKTIHPDDAKHNHSSQSTLKS